MTFLLFSGLELLLTMALALTWGATAWAANGWKYAALGQTDVSRWRRATRIGVWTGFILLVVWCALQMAVLLTLGWDFVMDRVAVMSPLLILPALFVGGFAWPALSAHASASDKSMALMAASVHTMWLGTLLVAYLVLFDIPSVPDLREFAAPFAVLTVCSVVLYAYHWRRAMTIRARRQGIRTMAGRSAVFALAAVIALTAWNLWAREASRFPPSMSMVHPETFDFGKGTALPLAASLSHHGHHGHHHAMAAAAGPTVSVTDLTGPRSGKPDKTFTLVAQKKTIDLPSGHTVEAWTFNGQVPGPELVVREGDLVEVTLINRDIEAGVTVHWHGVDVPNAEDGVPGVTQDAVMPGESHIYRFVVHETGSHWYHSHQTSSVQVAKGLFGAFIILPADGKDTGHEAGGETADITVFSHDWETPEGPTTVLHFSDPSNGSTIPPGTNVRLRLVNSASLTKTFTLNGAPFRVAAIDGWDIHEPQEVAGKRLKIGGGGRYDVTFTMPGHPVTLAVHGEGPEAADYLVFSGDGRGTPDTRMGSEILDPLAYGSPAPAPFDETTAFDREFLMVLDQVYFGYYNGRANTLWTINGEVFPHTPTYVVQEGELVKTRIVNRSLVYHPMHLHGHHVFVLSRNGQPYKGSPLWLDTVLVEPGETYEVAFRADNPGIWMDHCHVLEHAAWGMSMHLIYHNVTTPFLVGSATGNHPE
ncbi:MAG TPA: multicopper oxidase family protein [Paenibacillaceae bacterium]